MRITPNIKNTVIIYQWPLALPDLYRWAADNKYYLQPWTDRRGCYYAVAEKEGYEERITIAITQYVASMVSTNFSKLVLWGSFKPEQLTIIQRLMEEFYVEDLG